MIDSRTHYQSEIQRLSEQSTAEKKKNRFLVIARPLIFFPALALLLIGYTQNESPKLLLIIGWSLALVFAGMLVWHEAVRASLQMFQDQERLYRKLLARLDRNWSEIPMHIHSSAQLKELHSPCTQDLDVFEHRSLFHWINLASTSIGQRRLGEWIALWVPDETIRQRQNAVLDLRDQRPQRERILYVSSLLGNSHASPENFTHWATSPNWLAQHRWRHLASCIGPLVILLGILWILVAKGNQSSFHQYVGLAFVAVGLVTNILLMLSSVGAIHDMFSHINSNHREVDGYRELYRLMGKLRGDSTMVASLRRSSSEGEFCASVGFERLRVCVLLANLQRNSLMYVPYLLLQILIQWDFRILELLERWKRKFGNEARGWLDALANCEALLSAATIADENRQWAYREPGSDSVPIEGLQIGHPLLPDTKRVGNDLQVTDRQPLLLVTGSNMAGKSTLLRSLGLNVLLARTGAPVCAKTFKALSFELATSMRVQDSVQDGVSFFMAELHRLRSIVEQGKKEFKVGSEGRPVLALLDEILQGTNSRERQIAVLHVVQQLLRHRVITAISTHDLELADHPDIQRVAQIVHYREYFETKDGKEQMRFDYKMRPGPTPTTNALKLLELVGLKED